MPSKFTAKDVAKYVQAAFDGNKRAVTTYLASGMPVDAIGKIDPNAPDGITALYAAIYRGDIPLAEQLLDAGANPNLVLDGESAGHVAPELTCRSPLNLAVTSHSLKTIDLLLGRGADPRIRDSTRGSAAHNLLGVWPEIGHSGPGGDKILQDRLNIMLDRGVAINQQDSDGNTLLGLAISTFANLDTISMLFERGADATRVATGGATAIHAASAAGNVKALRFLVQRGVHVDLVDDEGRTALFSFDDPATGQALLEFGADVHHVDYDGLTALHHMAKWFAIQGDGSASVSLLLRAGCNPDQTSFEGKTPRDYASQSEFKDLKAVFATFDAKRAMTKTIKVVRRNP